MPDQLLGARAKDRWKRLVAAATYGLGVWLIAHLNVPHFLLVCGFNVSVLVLTPYRYWPLLTLAQSLSQLPIAIECVSSFGMLWSSLMLVPSNLFIGPIVYYFRERAHLFDRSGQVRIGKLLFCALLVALVLTGVNEVQIATVAYPPGTRPMHYDHLAAQWVLGNLIGILCVAPAVLAVRQAIRDHGWRSLLATIGESRSTFESICFIVPVLMILIWAGFAEPHLRGLAQVAMFVPVVWLALRHGWQGTALGGSVATLSVVWLMPEKYDDATIQAEVIVAFAICTMLLLGARIEVLDRRAERERKEVRSALALAQRQVQLGEMQLRSTAMALEHARETVRAGYMMMIGRLRHLQPAIDDGGYQRAASVAQDQLLGISESLHPTIYRERGLPAALREGAVARMLDHAGIRYWCELKGPLSHLSSTLHLALYRMVCEVIVLGCSQRDISDVCVRMRCRSVDGQRWVVASVAFRANTVRLPHVKWDDLAPRLVRTATGGGIKTLEDRAAVFEGYARERRLPDGRRIAWLMRDI
jgi:glucose-6-phosphate-specific signal transduction histidine kinase